MTTLAGLLLLRRMISLLLLLTLLASLSKSQLKPRAPGQGVYCRGDPLTHQHRPVQ